MKFSNLLAIVNLACAKQGFSGQHMRHKTVHYDSYKHGSFHDYFAHALSVMRYYYQKRGMNSDFCRSEMFSFFSEIKATVNECLNHLHTREELCLQALFDDDYFWS